MKTGMTNEELMAHMFAPEPEGHGFTDKGWDYPGHAAGRNVHTKMHTPGDVWSKNTQHTHEERSGAEA